MVIHIFEKKKYFRNIIWEIEIAMTNDKEVESWRGKTFLE